MPNRALLTGVLLQGAAAAAAAKAAADKLEAELRYAQKNPTSPIKEPYPAPQKEPYLRFCCAQAC